MSCTNNDQIPYFCQVYIPDIIYKMHEGEIDSPHKDPLYHILHKSSVFYLIVFTIFLWGEEADRKHFDLGRCSIHNADIYIIYYLLTTLKIGELFFLLKIGFNYIFFSLQIFQLTNLSKYLQIFWTQNKKVTY